MVKIGGSDELINVVDNFRQQVINDVIQYRIDHNKQWSKSADEKIIRKSLQGASMLM